MTPSTDQQEKVEAAIGRAQSVLDDAVTDGLDLSCVLGPWDDLTFEDLRTLLASHASQAEEIADLKFQFAVSERVITEQEARITALTEEVERLKACLRDARFYGNLRYSHRIPGQNDGYCYAVDRINAALEGQR